MKKTGTKFFVTALLIIMSSYHSIHGTIALNDISQKINETAITSPLNLFAPLLSGKEMIIGATVAGMKENSLIVVDGATKSYHGIVADKVMVNYKENSDNPLYDKQITLLAAQPLGSHPIVVTATEPKNLYLVQHYASAQNHNVLSLQNIKDSANKESNGIVAITAAPSIFAFAAVLGNESTQFGDEGSGIAAIWIREFERENKSRATELVQLDVLKEDVKAETKEEKETSEPATQTEQIKTPRAVSLDRSSSALKINHDLKHIENAIDMFWDSKLDRLYVGLQVQNGNNANAGACAIGVIRRIGSEKHIAEPAAPHTVLTPAQQNEIIGSICSGARSSIHKIRTMHNSAELPYLVILGGNGKPETTKRSVHALPLYTNPAEKVNSTFGQLAKKDSRVVTLYPNMRKNPSFYYRYFDAPATTAEDVFTCDDQAACVGGGQLREGDIDNIIIHRDLVCATVSSADEGCLPGIFYSRALLDEFGAITGWTRWQRMSGITDPVFGAVLNEVDNSFMFFPANTTDQKLHIKQTSWEKENEHVSSLESTINQYFPQGITNMVDFPADFNENRDPFFAILGNNTMALIKTGLINKGTVVPTSDQSLEKTATHYMNSSIDMPTDPEATVVIFTGGALQEIAPLTSIELVKTETQAWLLVGGVKGLALLCDENGNGFSEKEKNSCLFSSFRANMSFKKISSHRFVRKIINDRNSIYLLTDKTLERCELNTQDFASQKINGAILASTSGLLERGAFFDVLVSEKLALLATSGGLFRIGNNKDVASIATENEAEWQPIFLPESMGAITQLEVHSTTGKIQDASRSTGGMLYILDSCPGKNKSRIHRLAIKNTQGDAQVDDRTVTSATDIFTGKDNMAHATLSTCRKKIVTDGALLLSFPTNDKKKPGIISGGKLRGHVNDVIALPTATGEIEALVRESATGRWFVGGSFGLLIHE